MCVLTCLPAHFHQEEEGEEGEFDDEIYDCVPEELKPDHGMEEDGEEPDDIYDIPPGKGTLVSRGYNGGEGKGLLEHSLCGIEHLRLRFIALVCSKIDIQRVSIACQISICFSQGNNCL